MGEIVNFNINGKVSTNLADKGLVLIRAGKFSFQFSVFLAATNYF